MSVMTETFEAYDADSSGYGYGYGYGDGYGDGSGDGDGEKSEGIVALARRSIPAALQDDPRVLALWNSNADGTPANGGSGPAAYVGLRQSVKGPLELCTARGLHATLQPESWKGERTWIVALSGEVMGDAHKMAALEREIVAEVPR